jgi:3-oxoacyl-[acyl-carrier-protein] synthase III
MAVGRLSQVRLAGLTVAVPEGLRDWHEQAAQFGAESAEKTAKLTGVFHRRTAAPEVCASDLCHLAAEQLLDTLGWERDTIDAIVFVSQTPDYPLPATACTLQSRLGLPTSTAAFDVNLGCSGYPYGLWIAGRMIGATGFRRVLLLAGDTISHLTSPDDPATAGLFGDAGTATALEFDPLVGDIHVLLGTDGSGESSLCVQAGGARHPGPGTQAIADPSRYLHMEGADVFAFTLRVVPPLVTQLLESAGWTLDEVDHVVMHQANAFLLQHLARRLKIPAEKLVVALDGYGNTSCASIPLALADALADQLATEPQRLLLIGFGVGWSWGGIALTTGPMPRPQIVVCSSTPRELAAHS